MTAQPDGLTFSQRLKAKQQQPAPVPAQRPAAVIEGDNPRAQRWAQRKLEETCAQISTEPEGGRNHALNAAAYSLGRLIPKWLEEWDTADRLALAAVAAGLSQVEARRTIQSGINAGRLDPRDPPVDDSDDGWVVFGVEQTAAPVALPTPDTEGQPLTPEQIADLAHTNRVTTELLMLRARHDAKQLHTAELAAKTFRAPAYTHTLTDELALPEEPVTYAVQDILPTRGNALLTAAFKSGKTTLVTNLLRSYADGDPFLGRFTVTPGAGRIGIFNYELSAEQYRRWLRAQGIQNTDRVAVLHLRGHRLPLTSPSVEDWIVAWLLEQEVTFWIADPFARAATGTDENSNTEVGVWLDTFDVIKERAGVSEAVLATHTGRTEMEQGQERARGATRLDDWADVRWLLVKDDEERRYFRATGRDVDLAEEQLAYDPVTRALTIGGGDRRWHKGRDLEQHVLDYINEHPGCGIREIQNAGLGQKEAVNSARGRLVARHLVRVENGPRRAELHYANAEEA